MLLRYCYYSTLHRKNQAFFRLFLIYFRGNAHGCAESFKKSFRSGLYEHIINATNCLFEVFFSDTDNDVQFARALVNHLDIDSCVCQSGKDSCSARALITRINYGDGGMELNKTQTVTGADAEHISHAISGDEYNGRLSLFSNDSANIYDISTHNIYYSSINICTLWLFDNDLGVPVKKALTYEDTDFESARYNTFYHSMLYVYRDYSSAYNNDDTYQAANNIQLDEVYDFSDPNKITQVTPDDKMIAVSTANNFFHYGTNYNDDIAVRTDSTSFDSFSVKILDKSKTEKQETLLYGSSGRPPRKPTTSSPGSALPCCRRTRMW